MSHTMTRLLLNLRNRLADDRGDVPGWVMVTLMTAGLVAAIWAVAEGALTDMFKKAMQSVSNK